MTRRSPLAIDSPLTNTDKQYYAANPLALWVWKASPGACLQCQALDGRKFFYPDVPARPHPHCKCTVAVVGTMAGTEDRIWQSVGDGERLQRRFGVGSELPHTAAERKRVTRYLTGTVAGFDDVAREHFLGGQLVKVAITNLGSVLGGVFIETNLGGSKAVGIRLGKTVSTPFDHFGEEPLRWEVVIRVTAGDNALYHYIISSQVWE